MSKRYATAQWATSPKGLQGRSIREEFCGACEARRTGRVQTVSVLGLEFRDVKSACERGAPARVKQRSSRSIRKSLIFGRNEIHMLNDDRGEAALAFFELNAELSIDGFGERNGTILECFSGFG